MDAIAYRPIPDNGPSNPIQETRRDNPRYESVVDKLVSPDATQEERDRAYDIVAQVEQEDMVCYTDEALTQRAAEELAADGTVPLNIQEVAPLVPPGTALGPFESADEAAAAMLDYANPISINDNLEQFGIVVMDPETGNYYITTPVAGEEHSVPWSAINSVSTLEGMEIVAWYHTHGADQPNYADHQFSENDKNFTENGSYGSVGYLGTPDGTYRKYDADTDSDTELQH